MKEWLSSIIASVNYCNEDENPLMTFPIKKRVNTELLIEKRGITLYTKRALKNKGFREEGQIMCAN